MSLGRHWETSLLLAWQSQKDHVGPWEFNQRRTNPQMPRVRVRARRDSQRPGREVVKARGVRQWSLTGVLCYGSDTITRSCRLANLGVLPNRGMTLPAQATVLIMTRFIVLGSVIRCR
jgi:hypothetical protein